LLFKDKLKLDQSSESHHNLQFNKKQIAFLAIIDFVYSLKNVAFNQNKAKLKFN
jgi:hypothetical protein